MIFYIRNEVQSALKRRGTYIYFGSIVILSLLANIAMIAFRTIYGMNEGAFGYNLIYFAEWCFIIPYYSTILIADIVFGKTCPNPRIKDRTTIGLSRTQLYIGKFMGELCVGFVFLVAAILCYVGITYLFMAADGTMETWVITDFCKAAFTASPLWIAGVSIGNSVLFLFKRKKYAYITFFSITLIIPRIIMFLAAEPLSIGACHFFKEYILLTPRFNELPYYATLSVSKIIILGVVYTILSMAIGLISYRKREF